MGCCECTTTFREEHVYATLYLEKMGIGTQTPPSDTDLCRWAFEYDKSITGSETLVVKYATGSDATAYTLSTFNALTNLELLEFIAESEYDKLKSESLNGLTEIKKIKLDCNNWTPKIVMKYLM